MAAFQLNNNDVCEVTMVSEYQGQQVRNVWHYQASFTFTTFDDGPTAVGILLTQFDSEIINPAANKLQALVVPAFACRGYRGQVVYPIRKPYISRPDLFWTGSNVSVTGIPSDTNITVDLRTLSVGRGLTGNKKFTGLPLSAITANEFTAGTVTDWGTVGTRFANPILDVANNINWYPLVWSPRRPTDRRQVWNTTTQPEVRVLRRRQKGIGI